MLCYLLIWMEIAFDACSCCLGARGERTDQAELMLMNSDDDQRGGTGRSGAGGHPRECGRQDDF